MEWFQVIFSHVCLDYPEVEFTLREDFLADIVVKSRKRKVYGKKLMWLESILLRPEPDRIVEYCLQTIQAGP